MMEEAWPIIMTHVRMHGDQVSEMPNGLWRHLIITSHPQICDSGGCGSYAEVYGLRGI